MWMLVPGWYFAALATGTRASSEPTKLGRAVATKPTARMAQANEVVIAGDIIDLPALYRGVPWNWPRYHHSSRRNVTAITKFMKTFCFMKTF
jgi:hypothetical protein